MQIFQLRAMFLKHDASSGMTILEKSGMGIQCESKGCRGSS